MAHKKKLLGMILTFGIVLSGCSIDTDEQKEKEKNDKKIKSTSLFFDTWADGQITPEGEQWFKFTATAGTHWFHMEFGSLGSAYVQLRDSDGNAMGTEDLRFKYYSKNFKWTVTRGNVYYLKVRSYVSSSGTYRVAFNTSEYEMPHEWE